MQYEIAVQNQVVASNVCSLGKGEVESPILSGSTIFPSKINTEQSRSSGLFGDIRQGTAPNSRGWNGELPESVLRLFTAGAA